MRVSGNDFPLKHSSSRCRLGLTFSNKCPTSTPTKSRFHHRKSKAENPISRMTIPTSSRNTTRILTYDWRRFTWATTLDVTRTLRWATTEALQFNFSRTWSNFRFKKNYHSILSLKINKIYKLSQANLCMARTKKKAKWSAANYFSWNLDIE